MWLSGRATAYCLGKGAAAGPIPAMGARLFGFSEQKGHPL